MPPRKSLDGGRMPAATALWYPCAAQRSVESKLGNFLASRDLLMVEAKWDGACFCRLWCDCDDQDCQIVDAN